MRQRERERERERERVKERWRINKGRRCVFQSAGENISILVPFLCLVSDKIPCSTVIMAINAVPIFVVKFLNY